MASTNTQIVLRERPQAEIDPRLPGTFALHETPVPSELPEGHILVKNLFFSIDPAMRGWLNDQRSYVEPVQVGAVMRAFTVGTVIKSNDASTREGEYVRAALGLQDYAVVPAKIVEKIQVGNGIEAVDYIGILGVGTLTAYFGVMDVLKIKEGDVVIVDGAAGSTGSVVVQMCKLLGCTVIATAGTDEKCKWVKETLGADEAFNYKGPNFKSDFIKAVKGYGYATAVFENVGGEQLDLNLSVMRTLGRIAFCGSISQYNTNEPYAIKNIANLIKQQVRLEGFIVTTYQSRWPEALKQIKEWVASGKLSRQYDIVEGGPTKAPQALFDIFQGKNMGKLLVKAKI